MKRSKKRCRRILVAPGLLCFLLGQVAVATEYWVDQNHPSASDRNPGTRSEPWLTIGHAAELLQPGDRVRVRPGVYREQVTPRHSGTIKQPILYRAEGNGVVVSGADRLSDWIRATKATCPGNAYWQKIWVCDIEWQPKRLFCDGDLVTIAREPDAGWWVAQGGSTHTVIDTKNLNQAAGFWKDGTVFFWDVSTTTQGWRKITAYDPETHTLTLAEPIWRDRVVEANADRYFIENTLAALDQPGEWCVVPIGDGFRVYLWPSDQKTPEQHLIEAARRSRFVFGYADRQHLKIEGFEVRHGAGHGIGSWSRGAADITIRNCYVHDNLENGIYVRFAHDILVQGNLVTHNAANGVTVGTTENIRIEANEIADNDVDGLVVSHNSARVMIRHNYIHGHTRWQHPDNIQFHNNVQQVTIEENVLLNGGQALMMEQCQDGLLRGNVIVGANAYAVICGHENVNRFRIVGNTIAFTGYGTVSFTGTDHELRQNVLVPGGRGPVFSVLQATGFQSDLNLGYKLPAAGGTYIAFATTWASTLDDYRAVSHQDERSVQADPHFRNAPVCCFPIDNRRLAECTASKLFVQSWPDAIRIGDHVEIHFDGIVRTVKATGSDFIVIDPPLPAVPEKGGLILNWKQKTDYTLDVRRTPASPGDSVRDRVGDLGANLEIAAFARGDVDSDGTIDIRRAD